jgi:hypothetical protein
VTTQNTEPVQQPELIPPESETPEVVIEAPPIEAPASEPAASGETVAPSSVTPPTPEPQALASAIQEREQAVQEREREAQRRDNELRSQMQQAEAEQDIRAYQSQLEEEGLSPERVQSFVTRERKLRSQVFQVQMSVQDERDTLRGQHNASLHYSKLYGIPFNDIAQMGTPQEMEAAGRVFAADQSNKAEIAKLKATMTAMKQDSVSAGQVFDDGLGSAPPNKAARRSYLADLERPLTDAEHKEFGELIGLN